MTSYRSAHLYVLFFSLLNGACEWKPPRRPVHNQQELHTKKAVLNTEVDKERIKVKLPTIPTKISEESNTLSQKVKADRSSDFLQASTNRPDVQDKNHSVTAQVKAKIAPPIDPSLPTSATETPSLISSINKNDSKAKSSKLTPQQSLEERLQSLHYLLTIDPDGPPLIHIKELTIAKSVYRREPKEASLIYDVKTKQVTTFLRVRNFEKTQKIQLRWMYKNEIIQLDRLHIGISPRWRTWSSLRFNIQEKRYGEWRVEVTTGKGKLLGVTHFVRQSKNNLSKD